MLCNLGETGVCDVMITTESENPDIHGILKLSFGYQTLNDLHLNRTLQNFNIRRMPNASSGLTQYCSFVFALILKNDLSRSF